MACNPESFKLWQFVVQLMPGVISDQVYQIQEDGSRDLQCPTPWGLSRWESRYSILYYHAFACSWLYYQCVVCIQYVTRGLRFILRGFELLWREAKPSVPPLPPSLSSYRLDCLFQVLCVPSQSARNAICECQYGGGSPCSRANSARRSLQRLDISTKVLPQIHQTHITKTLWKHLDWSPHPRVFLAVVQILRQEFGYESIHLLVEIQHTAGVAFRAVT